MGLQLVLGIRGGDSKANTNGDVYNFYQKGLKLLGAVGERRACSQGGKNASPHLIQCSLLQSLSPAPNP